MFDDFRLKLFTEVVRQKSFTKAASVLGVTQPAVSQNVAELEKMTGVKLFRRLRSEVHLTEEGEVFHQYVLRMLAASNHASGLFGSFSPFFLKVSASDYVYTYIFMPALEGFLKVHHEISVETSTPEEADLVLQLKPSSALVFDTPADCIAQVRMSISLPKQMGDQAATHEKVSSFDLLFQPSESFADTSLCRALKTLLTSF